jgi:hypothetical protein
MLRSKVVLGTIVMVFVTVAMATTGATQAADTGNLSQPAAGHPQAAFCADNASSRLQTVPVAQFLTTTCNGGSCDYLGIIASCPTSGGPTCAANQICACVCISGGGTANECISQP